MKKYTFVVVSILFSVILFGCKEFTGSNATAEELFTVKYSQEEDAKINHPGTTGELTVTINNITNPVKDANGNTTGYSGSLVFNKSLKSTEGISIKKISSEYPAQPFTLSDMAATIAFDKEDMLQKTVVITVPGDTMPDDYIIIVDKNAEAITGQKLDEDGDGYWGEDEDLKYSLQQGTAKGFFKTGRENWSGSFNFTGTLSNETLTVRSSIFSEENKATVDQNIFVQRYDASTDTWVTIDGNPSTMTQPGNIWEKTYTVQTYSPLRIYSNNLRDVKFKVTNDLLVPYSTNKYDNSPVYRTAAITDNDKFYGNYIDPFRRDYTSDFKVSTVTDLSNVYKLSFDNTTPAAILNSASWSSSKTETISVGNGKKFSGVSTESIKVYENTAGKNIYSEVKLKEINTKDREPDAIYLVLENKTVSDLTSAKLAIVATPALSYIYEDGTDASKTVTLSFGHLNEADSMLTKKGNVILWKNF